MRPTVRAVLDRLDPAPAFVLNRLADVLAHTTGYERLARSTGLLEDEPPNLVRFLCTDPRARTLYPDWERVADEHIAHLKTAAHRDDPHLASLVDELTITAGASFTDRWQAPPVLPARTGIQRWAHPEAGQLRLAYETLDLADADDQRLIIHLAADEPTSTALDHLTGRHPGALRSVTG